MNSGGDAFGSPLRDPGRDGKIAVQGLILIIPIVGWIAAAGWIMLTYENLKAGRQELAPAGFHLERGIGLFGVILIYSIVIDIPSWVVEGIGSAASNQSTLAGNQLTQLGSLRGFLAQLFLPFLTPSLLRLPARDLFSGGFTGQAAWAVAT